MQFKLIKKIEWQIFFWRDGRSRIDYNSFGDVICFDATYRTNKYNMICAPFVGVNHHWNNVLFDCAFLLDETTVSFTWLFETFLESMGNQKPKTIFTNQCQAMKKAIRVCASWYLPSPMLMAYLKKCCRKFTKTLWESWI